MLNLSVFGARAVGPNLVADRSLGSLARIMGGGGGSLSLYYSLPVMPTHNNSKTPISGFPKPASMKAWELPNSR